MEFSESTSIVFHRIKKLEPENATKILGCLWCKGLGDQEMIKLATSSDVIIQELIYKAKSEIASSPIPPFMTVTAQPFLSTAAFHVPSTCWEPPAAVKHTSDFARISYLDSISEIQNQTQFFSLADQKEQLNLGKKGYASDYFYSNAALGNLCARTGRRFPSITEFPIKTCHYFKKGFCKHGNNCRYLHGKISETSPLLLDVIDEDQVFSANSLKKLELEIIEILKSRKGYPVSIASLPMIYYEKYGKHLQAEVYLSERQRHGKSGYTWTRLLARLKDSIRLIDRPHGQHAVILAEDAPKYMENRVDRNDPGTIVRGSQQIYLTFRAESTFTEEDVSNYFSNFGPVEDVRIPSQLKRMFGFVTFESADTVKMILENRNSHYVCGARVLVKPYREKSKIVDRKYQERIEQAIYYDTHYAVDAEFHPMPRAFEISRLLRKEHVEKQEQALELERRRLARLQIARKPMVDQSNFGHSVESKFCYNFSLPSADHFRCLLDVMNRDSPNDEKIRHKDTNYSDHDSSDGLNLPENPFASQNS